MAKIISHRGNLTGPNSVHENSIEAIDHCIYDLNIGVEIDLRCLDGKLFLGHDQPEILISPWFLRLRHEYLYIHTKNPEALDYCLKENFPLHYFTHENDPYTITSYGYIWAYPGHEPVGWKTIGVMPEGHWPTLPNFYGICTDYPMNYISIKQGDNNDK